MNLRMTVNVHMKVLVVPVPEKFNTFNTFNTFDHAASCHGRQVGYNNERSREERACP